MDVQSPNNVDVTLRLARAFIRARGDKELLARGFVPRIYLWDKHEIDR